MNIEIKNVCGAMASRNESLRLGKGNREKATLSIDQKALFRINLILYNR